MGATGTAVLDFGAFPGKVDASVAITGQAAIGSGSRVEAWIDTGTATAAHSKDEHILAAALLDITYGNIVAGTGFTIFGFARDTGGSGGVSGEYEILARQVGRLYGTFTIAWAWL